MTRFVLAFVLLVFSVNAAQASLLMTCCPKQEPTNQYAQTPPSSPPCHDSHPSSSIKKLNATGCLCSYTCAVKLGLDDLSLALDRMTLYYAHPFPKDEIGHSQSLRPEYPPPKV